MPYIRDVSSRDRLLQIAPHRLLGFAFAIADLLIEVGPSGKVSFAVGAAAVLAGDGERQLITHRWVRQNAS